MIEVGVPERVPVDVSMDSPVGNVGDTDHKTTVPPLDVGVTAVIREPLVRVNGFPLYAIDEGMTSLTTMVTVAEELPPVLVAVTVYEAEGESAVGVPEIAPVEVSKDRPFGSEGVTDHESTSPPLADGIAVVIAEPLVRVNGVPLYETEYGATSLTWIVTVVVSLPPALDAVTVYVVEADTAVGVPPIAPVEVEKDKPAGRDGVIAHKVTVPPLEVGVTVVIALPLVKTDELGL